MQIELIISKDFLTLRLTDSDDQGDFEVDEASISREVLKEWLDEL